MTDSKPERFYTPAEMARLFHVNPKTVSRWHKNGRLAEHGIRVFRTLGNVRRFSADDVDRYLAEGGRS
jgi:excisionase family DNA binding protein